jgi:undecaprenyl phosphate-alpha-L-ara4N flippase subunit ArnF
MRFRNGTGVGIAALTICILASASAQLLLKTGVSGSPVAGLWWIVGGLAAYGVSLLAWLHVLARLPLSVAYPLLSISYVLVYIGAIASPLLAEELTPMRAIGVLLVACGAAVVTSTHRTAE